MVCDYIVNMIFDYITFEVKIGIWLNCDKILDVYRNLFIHPIKHARGIKIKTDWRTVFQVENIKSQHRGPRGISQAWIQSAWASLQKTSTFIANIFCVSFINMCCSFYLTAFLLYTLTFLKLATIFPHISNVDFLKIYDINICLNKWISYFSYTVSNNAY